MVTEQSAVLKAHPDALKSGPPDRFHDPADGAKDGLGI